MSCRCSGRSVRAGTSVPWRRQSTYQRWPASVGTRPAEVCGWASRPCSSSIASSLRTVDGPAAISASPANVFEPTGSPVAAYASTTLRRISSWRGDSTSAMVGRGAGSADPQLGLGVADDRLAVLLGDRVDADGAVGDPGHGGAHDDLVLGQPHA